MVFLANLSVIGERDNNLFIEIDCPFCSKISKVEVTKEGFTKWDRGRGVFVQTAFPELPPEDRELFISGICAICFRDM